MVQGPEGGLVPAVILEADHLVVQRLVETEVLEERQKSIFHKFHEEATTL